MQDMLLGPVSLFATTNATPILAWSLLVLAFLAYIIIRPSPRFQRIIRWVLGVGIVLSIAVAILLSFGQYTAFNSSEVGRLLLPPAQPWSYVIGYVLLRYWLALGLALLMSALWFGFVRLIHARSDRYFDVGELALTTLVVFAVGWPGVVVLLPLAAVFLVVVSVVRLTIFKYEFTTLGLPFLLAGVVTLLFAPEIRTLFGY